MRIAQRGLFIAACVLVSSRVDAQDADGELIGPPAPPPSTETDPSRTAERETPPPAVALTPHAEPPPITRFGAAGVFLLTNSTSLGLAATRYDTGDASSTSVSFSPGFDYFVTRHLSLGIDAWVSYAEQRRYSGDASLIESKTTALGVGPRLGLDIPIADLLSFYPRITVGFESRHDEDRLVYGSPKSAPDALATTRGGLFVLLFAPLLLHPAPHLPGPLRAFPLSRRVACVRRVRSVRES
jgi:hypothetical protein